MRHLKSKGCLGAALCLLMVHPAQADTMRCGNRLIEDGDSLVTVRALCGRPTLAQHSFLVRSTTVRVGSRGLSQSHTVGTEVPVETWTYDRGPNKLLMRIRFVDGRVTAIKTLSEWGH